MIESHEDEGSELRIEESINTPVGVACVVIFPYPMNVVYCGCRFGTVRIFSTNGENECINVIHAHKDQVTDIIKWEENVVMTCSLDRAIKTISTESPHRIINSMDVHRSSGILSLLKLNSDLYLSIAKNQRAYIISYSRNEIIHEIDAHIFTGCHHALSKIYANSFYMETKTRSNHSYVSEITCFNYLTNKVVKINTSNFFTNFFHQMCVYSKYRTEEFVVAFGGSDPSLNRAIYRCETNCIIIFKNTLENRDEKPDVRRSNRISTRNQDRKNIHYYKKMSYGCKVVSLCCLNDKYLAAADSCGYMTLFAVSTTKKTIRNFGDHKIQKGKVSQLKYVSHNRISAALVSCTDDTEKNNGKGNVNILRIPNLFLSSKGGMFDEMQILDLKERVHFLHFVYSQEEELQSENEEERRKQFLRVKIACSPIDDNFFKSLFLNYSMNK